MIIAFYQSQWGYVVPLTNGWDDGVDKVTPDQIEKRTQQLVEDMERDMSDGRRDESGQGKAPFGTTSIVPGWNLVPTPPVVYPPGPKPDKRTGHFYRDVAISSAKKLLDVCGYDMSRPGREDTAERFVNALLEMTAGYEQDPTEILSKQFEESSDEMVIVEAIEFTSLCEHHLLPFVGTVNIGYIPGPKGKVVGLSKFGRLVDCFSRRLQMQERMTREIGTTIMGCVDARGVGVVVRASHSCMGCRGVRKPESRMVTSCMLGVFRNDPIVRQEFLMLCVRGE